MLKPSFTRKLVSTLLFGGCLAITAPQLLNSARGDDGSLGPDLTEVDAVSTRLPPPYDLRLSTLAELVYRVPRSRLEKFVPAPYRLGSIAGSSYLSILIAHYSQDRSLVTGNESGPYDEICYLTQVIYRGKRGNYYFKLHLNSRDAWVLGRGLYGYPKDLAAVEIKDDASSLSVRSEALRPNAPTGRELLFLDAEKEKGVERPVAVTQGKFAGLIQGFYAESFFIRGEDLLSARFELSVGDLGARRLKLRTARMPFAVAEGLLEPGEIQSPLLALSFDRARLRLEAPSRLRP